MVKGKTSAAVRQAKLTRELRAVGPSMLSPERYMRERVIRVMQYSMLASFSPATLARVG